MRHALYYSSCCVLRSCGVAACPFNVELPGETCINTLVSTVLSMNVQNKPANTFCCHWTGSENPVWNLRRQLMKIHSILCGGEGDPSGG